jgi:hypothetical protein
MTDLFDAPTIDEAPPKQRRCLSCRKPFQSAWAGERVCRACKSTRAWKQGERVRSVSSRSRSVGGSAPDG